MIKHKIKEGVFTWLQNGYKNYANSKEVTLEEAIELIKTQPKPLDKSSISDKSKLDAYKAKLPSLMTNGTFASISANSVQSLSFWFAADIDFKHLHGKELSNYDKYVTETLQDDRYVYLYQKTASCNGYWALINIEIGQDDILNTLTASEIVLQIFKGVETYFKKKGIIVDEHTKNLDRKRAISGYRPFVKDAIIPFHIDFTIPEIINVDSQYVSNFNDEDVKKYVIDFLQTHTVGPGHRNDNGVRLGKDMNRAGVKLVDLISIVRSVIGIDIGFEDALKRNYNTYAKEFGTKGLPALLDSEASISLTTERTDTIQLKTDYIEPTDIDNIVKKCKPGINIIVSDPGTGKSTALLKWSKTNHDNNEETLLIEPTILLRDNCGDKVDFDIYLHKTKRERLKRIGTEACTVMCNAMFQNILKGTSPDGYYIVDDITFKYIVFDEAHLLLHTFPEWQKIYTWADEQSFPVIFITATPDEALKHRAVKIFDISTAKKKRELEILSFSYRMKRQCKNNLFSLISKTHIIGEKSIIFYNDIKETDKIINELKNHFINIKIMSISSMNRCFDEVKEGDWDICFTTQVMGCGVDLLNVCSNFIVYDPVGRCLPIDIVQFVNRERRFQKIKLFIIRKTFIEERWRNIEKFEHNNIDENIITSRIFKSYDRQPGLFLSEYYRSRHYDFEHAIEIFQENINLLYKNKPNLLVSKISDMLKKTFDMKYIVYVNVDINDDNEEIESKRESIMPPDFIKTWGMMNNQEDAVKYLKEIIEKYPLFTRASKMLELIIQYENPLTNVMIGKSLNKMYKIREDIEKRRDESVQPILTKIYNDIDECIKEYVDAHPDCLTRDIIANVKIHFPELENHAYIRHAKHLKKFLLDNGYKMRYDRSYARFTK